MLTAVGKGNKGGCSSQLTQWFPLSLPAKACYQTTDESYLTATNACQGACNLAGKPAPLGILRCQWPCAVYQSLRPPFTHLELTDQLAVQPVLLKYNYHISLQQSEMTHDLLGQAAAGKHNICFTVSYSAGWQVTGCRSCLLATEHPYQCDTMSRLYSCRPTLRVVMACSWSS
jgi:hypothetical protein